MDSYDDVHTINGYAHSDSGTMTHRRVGIGYSEWREQLGLSNGENQGVDRRLSTLTSSEEYFETYNGTCSTDFDCGWGSCEGNKVC